MYQKVVALESQMNYCRERIEEVESCLNANNSSSLDSETGEWGDVDEILYIPLKMRKTLYFIMFFNTNNKKNIPLSP